MRRTYLLRFVQLVTFFSLTNCVAGELPVLFSW